MLCSRTLHCKLALCAFRNLQPARSDLSSARPRPIVNAQNPHKTGLEFASSNIIASVCRLQPCHCFGALERAPSKKFIILSEYYSVPFAGIPHDGTWLYSKAAILQLVTATGSFIPSLLTHNGIWTTSRFTLKSNANVVHND